MTRRRYPSRDPRPCGEELIHKAVVQLLRFKSDPNLIWFHCPNGIPASPATGARFVALGMKAGVADLVFGLPDGRIAFLEIKTRDGRQSIEQKTWQLRCEANNFPYSIARSVSEAEAILESWGALRGSRDSVRRVA